MKSSDSGILPVFGAVFMSNRSTKEECFQKKLFGLPANCLHFVKKLKAGMILFLFEYEKRELYGVFEACSDGAINIVPDAYSSSGKQFPAQHIVHPRSSSLFRFDFVRVQISTIWNCQPLSEHEFGDVIKENYYASNKFNSGLSKEQVQRLLCLFDSKRLSTCSPQTLLNASEATGQQHESGGKMEVKEKDKLIATESSRKKKLKSIIVSKSVISTGETGSSSSVILTEDLGMDLGDYIPLPSPDHSDSASTDCTNLSVEDMSFIPHLSIPESSSRDTKSNMDDDEWDRWECRSMDREEDSNSDYEDEYPIVKGLYSDSPNKGKLDVFSRLTYSSKPIVGEKQVVSRLDFSSSTRVERSVVEKKQDKLGVCFRLSFGSNTEVEQSVQEIMAELEKKHGNNWGKKNSGKGKSGDHGPVMLKKRTSVFSRLNVAPKVILREVVEETGCGNTELAKRENENEGESSCSFEEWCKRRRLFKRICL